MRLTRKWVSCHPLSNESISLVSFFYSLLSENERIVYFTLPFLRRIYRRFSLCCLCELFCGHKLKSRFTRSRTVGKAEPVESLHSLTVSHRQVHCWRYRTMDDGGGKCKMGETADNRAAAAINCRKLKWCFFILIKMTWSNQLSEREGGNGWQWGKQ